MTEPLKMQACTLAHAKALPLQQPQPPHASGELPHGEALLEVAGD